MLSHHEDRELKAIEQWFEESDPVLTRMLRDHDASRHRHLPAAAARVAIDIVGAAMFIAGAVLSQPIIIVIGFLLIVLAVGLHLATGGPRREEWPPY
ncbi:DUF3040 domain-containing protein [Actinophytocola sp.]|uniref:DUF3040 domain-containing protein n=1 Tax=Actinophytocola sp. TaxID=1872138 RepID=UPI003D6B0370